VLVGTIHPVFAIEFLRDHIAVFENLPLLMRQVKVHRGTLQYRIFGPAGADLGGERSRSSAAIQAMIALAIFRQKPLGFQSNNR
jgi:hypothetical protein